MNTSRCNSRQPSARSCFQRDHDAFGRDLIAIGQTADRAASQADKALARADDIYGMVIQIAAKVKPSAAAELGLPARAPAPAPVSYTARERGALRLVREGETA